MSVPSLWTMGAEGISSRRAARAAFASCSEDTRTTRAPYGAWGGEKDLSCAVWAAATIITAVATIVIAIPPAVPG
ncbi:hypothetical protein [Nonomuraea glycinis]|uniref:hypothetical protein n=1 Tax=Nonomuraea glycinis TaxID=2047744 RepID=UPI0033A0F36F